MTTQELIMILATQKPDTPVYFLIDDDTETPLAYNGHYESYGGLTVTLERNASQ